MNPIAISSSSVSQFGYKVLFDLYNNKISFDIDGHTIGTFTQIGFEITDPYNNTLKTFGADITTGTTYEMAMDMIFQGAYTIKGKLTDDSSNIHYIEQTFTLCNPKLSDRNCAEGLVNYRTNCSRAELTIKDSTLYSYNDKTAKTITKNWAIHLPDAVTKKFTHTPAVYPLLSGDHIVSGYSDATYEFDDNISVLIRYCQRKTFRATCESNIAKLVCCMQKLVKDISACSDTNEGEKRRLASLQLKATSIFAVAVAKEAGQADSSEEYEQLRQLLNCDCADCDDVLKLERDPIIIGTDYNFDPECFEIKDEGGLPVISCNKKLKIKLAPSDCNYISIDPQDDGTYLIGVNCDDFNNAVTNVITSNTAISNYFTNVVQQMQYSVNPKCVPLQGIIDYTALACGDLDGFWLLKSIKFSGQAAQAAGLIDMNDHGAVSTYLNGLGLGNFTVLHETNVDCGYGNGFQVKITSANNANVPEEIVIASSNNSVADVTIPFAKQITTTIDNLLQGVFDYLCEMCIEDIILCEDYEPCVLGCQTRYEFNGAVLSSPETWTWTYYSDATTELTAEQLAKLQSAYDSDNDLSVIIVPLCEFEIHHIYGVPDVGDPVSYLPSKTETLFSANTVSVPSGEKFGVLLAYILQNGCSMASAIAQLRADSVASTECAQLQNGDVTVVPYTTGTPTHPTLALTIANGEVQGVTYRVQVEEVDNSGVQLRVILSDFMFGGGGAVIPLVNHNGTDDLRISVRRDCGCCNGPGLQLDVQKIIAAVPSTDYIVQRPSVRVEDEDYTVLGTDSTIVADVTTSTVDLQLPPASDNKSRIFNLVKGGDLANTLTALCDGSDVIGNSGAGAASLVITDQISIQSDGTSRWYII